MSQQVPLAAVAAQTLSIILGGQNCQLAIYQKTTGLYLDLSVGGVPILNTMICRNAEQLLIDRTYLGFVGDLMFIDTQADTLFDGTDPQYEGLGAQYQLIYLTGAELASL